MMGSRHVARAYGNSIVCMISLGGAPKVSLPKQAMFGIAIKYNLCSLERGEAGVPREQSQCRRELDQQPGLPGRKSVV